MPLNRPAVRVSAGRGGGDQQQVAAGGARRQGGVAASGRAAGVQAGLAGERESPSPGPSPAGSFNNLTLHRGNIRAGDHVSAFS